MLGSDESKENRNRSLTVSLSDQSSSPTMTDYQKAIEQDIDLPVNYDSGVESTTSDRSSPMHNHISFNRQNSKEYLKFENGKHDPHTTEQQITRHIEAFSVTPLSGRLFDHTNPHELKPFVCDSCNCGFAEINSLRAHVRHSHPKKGIQVGIYTCAYCRTTFDDIDKLRQHFYLKHTSDNTEVRSSSSSLPITYTGRKRIDEYSSGDGIVPMKRAFSKFTHPSSPVRSPGGLSTSSDTTYDRPSLFKPYLPLCTAHCSCLRRSSFSISSDYHTGVVQKRYLSYLEQYHKLLESHVNLMEALKHHRTDE